MANKRQKKKMLKRQSPNQREYAKQIKLLKRRVATLERQGYESSEDIIPKTPKRITSKAIEQVKAMRGKELQTKFERIDYNTGEVKSYAEEKAEQRKERARQRKLAKEQSQYIATEDELNQQRIANFKAKLESVEGHGILGVVNWFNTTLNTIGNHRMGEILYEMEGLGLVFHPDDFYGSDKTKHTADFISYFEDMLKAIPEFKESEPKFEIEENAEEWEEVGDTDFWSGL